MSNDLQMEKFRLDAILHTMLGDDIAGNWWWTPNPAFNDRLPKDVYFKDPNGRQDVTNYIDALQINGHEQSN